MEKTKLKILLFMIGLFSFTKAYPSKCPQNYFINPTYKCVTVSCKEGQYLDLDGICKCLDPKQFMNDADGTCRSCPTDSVYDQYEKCDCSDNVDNIYFNETSWNCSRKTKTSTDSEECLDDQYLNYYAQFTENDQDYYPCVDCPNGKSSSSNSCNCPDPDEYFNFFKGKCIKQTCDTGLYYSYYYDKCIDCGSIEYYSFKANEEIACECPKEKFFNTLKGSCETLPDSFEKRNNTGEVRCKDQNSIMDLENNQCISCGDDAFAFNGKCFCRDLTKYYDSTEKKCISCGDYKARADLYSNDCNICINNHFKHWYEKEEQLEFECKECPEKSDSLGCRCKGTFEYFDEKSEKCIKCGEGASINEETLSCQCDDDDEFYDSDLRKCRKCPEGAVASHIPLFFGDSVKSCLCPPKKIYDKKSNKCLEACSEGETFGYECLPCPKYGSSDGNTPYCICGVGKAWDYETQTCKFYGEWSSSSYIKLCFGLFLIILFL